jgi:inhibitor of the pro-sigma K processing machinery
VDLTTIAAYGFGLLIIYLLARMLIVPLRILTFLLVNGAIGGLALWAINLLGAYFGLHLALNPVTALVTGLLGAPGVLLIFALSEFIY